jgi:hypothetical protein
VLVSNQPKGWRVNGATGAKSVWALCVPENG